MGIDGLTFEMIAAWLSEHIPAPMEKIEPWTRLQADLGVTGDDAHTLIMNYANRFEIDMTCYEFNRHFVPETDWESFLGTLGLFALWYAMLMALIDLFSGAPFTLLVLVSALAAWAISRPLAYLVFDHRPMVELTPTDLLAIARSQYWPNQLYKETPDALDT